MTSLYDGVYRGLKKFKQLSIISIVVGIFSVPIVYYFVKFHGLIGALIAQNIFYLLFLISLGLGYKELCFKIHKPVFKEIGKYSFIYGLAILGNYLFIRSGIIILGHYNYMEEIATYELLHKIFTIILLPFSFLGQVIAPNFTELSAKRDFFKIYSYLKSYTIYFFFIGLLVGGILYFIMPYIIMIFLNNYYNLLLLEIFPFALIILITNIWASTIDAGILVPTGYANLMAKFYIILGIFGTLLSLILVKFFNYMGVIYSFTVCNILMVVCLRISYFINLKSILNKEIHSG
jgi:O-antigen/teichoic acid export membrane protein